MRTAVVDPGGEFRSGGGGRGGAHGLAPLLGALGAQRVLFAFGGATGSRGLADIDQPATTGLITVEQSRRHRQLVEPELGVLLRIVLGDRTLSGFDIDDDQPTLRIAFQPVDPAADPNTRQPVAGSRKHAVESDLGADLGEFVAARCAPGDERRQHRAVAVEFVGGVPR